MIYEQADDKEYVKLLLSQFYLKLSEENEDLSKLNTSSIDDAITQIKLNLKKRESYKTT